MKRTIEVEQGAAGERLDVFLAANLEITRSQAHKLTAAGAVTVNNEAAKSSYLVRLDDKVAVVRPTAPPRAIAPPKLTLAYEDEDIMVVEKPAGLAAHPGNGLSAVPTVADFARPHTDDPDPVRPGIVHRLDRDTSGLMIIAKTLAAKANLQNQFRQGAVNKTYLALVVGHPKPSEAVISLPLDRDPSRPLQRAVIAAGRPAVTRYRVITEYPGYSLIEAHPETGRTHQIRVHFAAIGHPVAGDTVYGPSARPLHLKRQFLHAAALSFVAPSGQSVNLHSPLPPELALVVADLEKLV